MRKLRLLDLFCGAGGCAMGYHRAGFEVVGVDKKKQARFPFEWLRGDAMEILHDAVFCSKFDVICASPPCQSYSVMKSLSTKKHPALVPAVRQALRDLKKPYVIENVPGAPMENPIQCCGSFFKLDVRRHRLFESNMPLVGTPCDHDWQTPRFQANRSDYRRKGFKSRVVTRNGHDTRFNAVSSVVNVTGGGSRQIGGVALWRRAMGIDWMTRDELAQAIPPAYTEFLGRQLVQLIGTPCIGGYMGGGRNDLLHADEAK